MKRILLFTAVLFFTSSINTFAQRLVETGNNWNVLDVIWLSGWTNNYSIGLDTIVNGITYKQVFKNDELGGTYYTAPRFVRETEDGKVFSQDNVRGEVDEILLYDFGLQPGDTFQIGYPHSPWGGGVLTVSSVDTIVLSDGISRRRLILEDMNQWNNDSITWIEGIGDIGLGPFHAHLFYWTDSWAQLLCTYQEETLIFQNPEADSCFATITTSIEELDSNSSIKVYPNPVNDLLTLDLSQINQSFTEINIFNALGEMVYQNNKPIVITEINTRELQSGIYFLILKNKLGMSYSQRVVKR